MFIRGYLEQWASDPLIQVTQKSLTKQTNFSDPTDPFTLEQPFSWAACPFDYVITCSDLSDLTCLCVGIPSTIKFGKYKQS